MMGKSFQFTPLREGRHVFSCFVPAWTALFQFTPLREGRLFQVFCIPTEEIFQFTPLREGRQNEVIRQRKKRNISIHAPPRGATRGVVKDGRIQRDFNSRPSARGDLTDGIRGNPNVFQFTPLREGRPDGSVILRRTPKVFQFTPLREGRHFPLPRPPTIIYFNSRPSARGDPANWSGQRTS